MLAKVKLLTTQAEDKRDWFLQLIQTQDDIKNKSPLGKDEWSLSEIIEHLSIVDEAFLNYLSAPLQAKYRSGIKQIIQIFIVNFIMNNGIKVPVPSEKANPNGGLSTDELINKWSNIRKELHKILSEKTEKDLSQISFIHPISGNLNLLEALTFVNAHLNYHVKRTKRLMKKI